MHRRFPIELAALVLFWICVSLVPIWMLTLRYCGAHYDFGIYVQALARLSLSDPNPWLSGRQLHIFNDHFDPILWLAKPFTWVLPPPVAGLAAETFFVGASVLPFAWMHARGRLSRANALGLSALALFNYGVQDAVGFPIHPTTWATLPFALLICALALDRERVALGALVLLFACKEEFPFVGVALGTGLLLRRRWRFGVQVWLLTGLWLLGTFVLRRQWLGVTEDYSSRLFAGALSDPVAFLTRRLEWKSALSPVSTLLLAFIPVAIWAWRERTRPDWLLWGLLLPPLAVRFLGSAWRGQYNASVMVAVVAALAPMVSTRRVPRWVYLTTAALVLTTNELPLRERYRAVDSAWAARYPPECPALPERLNQLRAAIDRVRALPEGKVLLDGNLLAFLSERPEVYTVGGPQPDEGIVYDYVLVEKPPYGVPYPATVSRVGELLALWRATPGAEIIIDSPYVFLARGAFREAH